MTVRQPRYSKGEFTRRGTEIYERQVRVLGSKKATKVRSLPSILKPARSRWLRIFSLLPSVFWLAVCKRRPGSSGSATVPCTASGRGTSPSWHDDWPLQSMSTSIAIQLHKCDHDDTL